MTNSDPENPHITLDLHQGVQWLQHAKPLIKTPAPLQCLDPSCLISPAETAASTLSHYPARGFRLGRYFETLVQYLLSRQTGVQLLAKNLVIYEQGRTLGELDLVYLSASGQITHLEMAVKFYLYHPACSRFIGPGGRDQLANKRQRLLTHQFPLLNRPASQQTLQGLGITRVDQQALLLCGQLFYPLAMSTPALPDFIDRQHLRGWWLTRRQLGLLPHDPIAGFRVLEKHQWLTLPTSLAAADDWLSSSELAHQLVNTNWPVMVESAPAGAKWPWSGRGFIVPDEWPARVGYHSD